MSDLNRPVNQNLLRYHLNPKKFKTNPHAYPFLWKRITFKECVRTSAWGILGCVVWAYFTSIRHNNIHDFYREYCKAMGLPENLFAEGDLHDTRIKSVNFTSAERKEEIFNRVREIHEERLVELEARFGSE